MSEPSPYVIHATQLPTPRTFSFEVWMNGAPISTGYEFRWDFGDGETSKSPNPTHTYMEAGDFDVGVTVQKIKDRPDDEGADSGDEDPPVNPPKLRLNVN